MPAVCKSCGCSDIDTDHARGDAVCTRCGSVVDDHIIVSEFEFEENSAGGANIIGQFVSTEGNTLSLGQNFKQSLGKDSRQQIYNNGRHTINSLGSQLSLSKHCLESAFMFYKLAVSRRLTQGRRTIHVVGACLYLVCRTEKTPHLLIDISDVTQTDVFTLGRTFLMLSRELCIDVPTTDPSLYIHRFAHQLKFGDKENEVATTALRLVSRMKRDWMSTGRRPSGLCGAALIMASRLHGFNRTVKDVVKVVRLSHSTILQRLADFGKTASSKLTVDEFNKIDLEEEADPPSFTRARQRAKQAQMFGENTKYSSPELLAQLATTQEKVETVLAKRQMIEDDIANRQTVLPCSSKRANALNSRLPVQTLNVEPPQCTAFENTEDNLNDISSKDGNQQTIIRTKNEIDSTEGSNAYGSENIFSTMKELGEKEIQKTVALFNEKQKKAENEESSDEDEIGEDGSVLKKENEEEDGVLDLDGLDDSELDDCLLGQDEIEFKTQVWMEENGEFMEKLKEKEAREALEAEKKPKTDVYKKKKPRKKKNTVAADTADEAIKTMLAERKLSTKINYDVLRDLAAEGGVDVKYAAKTESKIEPLDAKESKDNLFFPTNPKNETKPTETSLRFRSGLKRPTKVAPNTDEISKKIKTELSPIKSSLKTTKPFIKEAPVKEAPKPQLETATSQILKIEEPTKEVDEISTIVENGPIHTKADAETEVDGEDYDDDFDDEGEAEDQPISASQLLGLGSIGGGGFADEDYGDTYEEGFY